MRVEHSYQGKERGDRVVVDCVAVTTAKVHLYVERFRNGTLTAEPGRDRHMTPRAMVAQAHIAMVWF